MRGDSTPPKERRRERPVRLLRAAASSTALAMTGNGGEGGIRTPGGVSPTHDFQSCRISRSRTSPRRIGLLAKHENSRYLGIEHGPADAARAEVFGDAPQRLVLVLQAAAPLRFLVQDHE